MESFFTPNKNLRQTEFYCGCVELGFALADISTMSKKQEHMPAEAPKEGWKPTHIRQWRKYRRYSQEVLAHLAHMSTGNLSQIERGNYPYSQDTLERLAAALGCEPADLLMRNPKDPEAPWALWERLTPEQRKQAIRLLKALADDADDNNEPRHKAA